jgi:hypothetical protein
MIAVLLLVGFVAAGIVIGLLATAHAPAGYQDENGFHYAPEAKKVREEIPSGVTRPRLA